MVKNSRCVFVRQIYSLERDKDKQADEFLSDLERNYFYITEFSDFIVDIREQFPLLPLEETLVIADELDIKHPTDPKTGEPIVMTTDSLLTINNGQGVFEVVHTIKMKDELLKERILEKFMAKNILAN